MQSMPVWAVSDLMEGERAILGAVRLWFRMGTGRGLPGIRTAIRGIGAPDEVLLPLFALLGVLATDVARRPRVLFPGDPRVSEDEAALLEALGALQHGDEDTAASCFDRWLPLVALCVAMASARETGRILAGAGVFLPERSARVIPLMAAE